jgi:hypothetical protein
MHTKTRSEPTGSPTRAAIAGPSRRDASVAVGDVPSPQPRNPVKILLARLVSALRGDEYMVGAYPPAEER